MKLQEKFKISSFVLTDPCYGSCDIADADAERLGAEVAFNIGHSISMKKIGTRTFMINAFDDVSFEEVLEEAVKTLKPHKKIGISTSSQHIHKLDQIVDYFNNNGIEANVGTGKGQLKDGQVFGCEFYPAFELKDKVNAFAFLGQSRFHAIGVGLSTGKPTYMIDTYFNEVKEINTIANELQKKATLAIYRARDADNFGLIIGLKEGQIMLKRSLKIKNEFEKFGKKVHLLAQREITSDKLVILKDIYAFIQTACPRVSIDDHSFAKPILSMPQAEALIKIYKGEEIGDFLSKSHWL